MRNVRIGCVNGPLTRYPKLRVAHAPGMPGTFYPPRVSDPDTCRDACRDRLLAVSFESVAGNTAFPRVSGKRFMVGMPHAGMVKMDRLWMRIII